MPQVMGHDLRFIYSLDPTRIITESAATVVFGTPAIAAEKFKGGSQAVPFEDGWLMVIHEWELLNGRRHYVHRLVWLDGHQRLRRHPTQRS